MRKITNYQKHMRQENKQLIGFISEMDNSKDYMFDRKRAGMPAGTQGRLAKGWYWKELVKKGVIKIYRPGSVILRPIK